MFDYYAEKREFEASIPALKLQFMGQLSAALPNVDIITFPFSGHGDEGYLSVYDADPQPLCTSEFEDLEQFLNGLIDLKNSGWENNEGSEGEIVFDLRNNTITYKIGTIVQSVEYEPEERF